MYPTQPMKTARTANDGASDVDLKRTNAVSELTQAGPKRLKWRYATYINCQEEFDVSEILGRASPTIRLCTAHPRTPNSAVFEHHAHRLQDTPSRILTCLLTGHDEQCHGPIRWICTEKNRRDYPEKFKYPCCERYGDEEPRTSDWHREYESYDYGVSQGQKY